MGKPVSRHLRSRKKPDDSAEYASGDMYALPYADWQTGQKRMRRVRETSGGAGVFCQRRRQRSWTKA